MTETTGSKEEANFSNKVQILCFGSFISLKILRGLVSRNEAGTGEPA